jgi:hypothetical protein
MNVEYFKNAVDSGDLDRHLATIELTARHRLEATRGSRTTGDFTIGDRVRFNELCDDSHLHGTFATVVAVGGVKIWVELDSPVGKYYDVVEGIAHRSTITVRPTVIDLVM